MVADTQQVLNKQLLKNEQQGRQQHRSPEWEIQAEKKVVRRKAVVSSEFDPLHWKRPNITGRTQIKG